MVSSVGYVAGIGTFGGVKLPNASDDGHTTGKDHTAALDEAKRALAKANAAVDADRAAHSPGCVACDQKLADQAQAQLAQISAAAQSSAQLDITV